MKNIYIIIICFAIFQACDYLDVVPDNVATIDNAFSDEITTENYLFTCYAGLPPTADISVNPVFLAGDEFWSWDGLISHPESFEVYFPWMIARGNQNTNSSYNNFYSGGMKGSNLFQTIRKCNTFLERIYSVKGLDEMKCKRWAAEAKTIKAYCIFYLMRQYGPIPLIKENISVSAEPEDVRLKRNTWNECVDYVVQLLDEATVDLPTTIILKGEELGRMTRIISLTLKAKVLATSASPQFNGNPYYTEWKNKDGQNLFEPKDDVKWKQAADACLEAIKLAETSGLNLFEYAKLGGVNTTMDESIKMEYTIRGIVTYKDWNDELIWGAVGSTGATIQKYAAPLLDPERSAVGYHMYTTLAVNMNVVKEFYTDNGVPIEEDTEWIGKDLEELRTAKSSEEKRIVGTTAQLNFEREGRFYGSLGFDCSVWYGNGKTDSNPWVLRGLFGETANMNCVEMTNITGYWPKKIINPESLQTQKQVYQAQNYPFPILRLGDLYLLYAETLNEVNGPSPEVYEYIDRIRTRAGLDGVVQSWVNHSMNPQKPLSQGGLREIIHRERLIELAFEGQRFWDLRRWLKTEEKLNKPVIGWTNSETEKEKYYKERILFTPTFYPKDYLWPINQYTLTINPNLVQAPGW